MKNFNKNGQVYMFPHELFLAQEGIVTTMDSSGVSISEKKQSVISLVRCNESVGPTLAYDASRLPGPTVHSLHPARAGRQARLVTQADHLGQDEPVGDGTEGGACGGRYCPGEAEAPAGHASR